jgi:steroid delta-isomerase-like uncharacterized protein
MSQHATAARRILEEAFNEGRLEVVDELVAPDAIDHDPQNPDAGTHGPAGLKTQIRRYRTAFPDLHLEVEQQLEDGDCVITRWRSSGTNDGDLMGMPPTHRHVEVTGIAIDRFADGQIVETWNNWDTLGMLQQLGVIPMAQQPA